MGGLPRRCRRGGCQRYPAGGLPRRCRLGGRQRYPAGGVPALSPAYTAFSFVFLPLSPQPPSRREGGDYRLFYARGCAPCIPGAEPARHWFALPLWKTQWGLAPALPARRVSAVPGGGVPALPPANPAFSLLPCPHPPSPLPGGKGEIFCFLMQGASPLASPGLNPRGTGAGGEPRTRRGCAFGIANSPQNR